MRIERHFTWTDGHKAIFDRDVARLDMFIDGARKRVDNLHLSYTVARTVFLAGSVVAPDSPEVRRALRFSAQALAALFVFARIQQPPRYVVLGEGPMVTFSTQSDESHLDLLNWQDAYYLSVITRQHDCLGSLCQVPYSMLMQSSTTAGAEINYKYVDLLKAVIEDQRFTCHSVFKELEQLCRSGPSGKPPNRVVRDLTMPGLEVLRQLEAKDEVAFNRSLDDAVRGHKKYWSSTKKLSEEWLGLVSLPLTAYAALGHDRGMRITVEADYLPMSWVTGTIFGEK